ncbi:MAG: hypothetical protein HRU19_07550 [Pseudobacteriovorax sp.]|nr:hypothetical protein [Pseudobacteriovorax sp.]
MHELTCPSCNKPSQYIFSDYLLMCPFCSTTFKFDVEAGQKEIFGDHYIVANLLDSATVKDMALEWLSRLHHRPGAVDKEFFVIDVQGFSLPVWVVSLEAHTAWKGLVKRTTPAHGNLSAGSEYLVETGQFRRGYRWAISARTNICETWGLVRLHEPPEAINVDWDGFPLDSTLSRGRLVDEEQKSVYEARNFFEFKYANGLPILGVQIDDQEALRRAKNHVDQYHYKISSLNVDYLLDYRTELEVAGIQLIHIPLWKVGYIYSPKNVLRHFYQGKEKKLLIDGHGKGVLNGELALVHRDKVAVNGYITGISSLIFLVIGLSWHPAFLLVALFSLIVSGISFFQSTKNKTEMESKKLEAISQSFGNANPNKASA